LASGRTVVPHPPTNSVSLVAADIRGQHGAWMGPVTVMARCMVMLTVAAFAILVLLPAAVAAQATVHI
jgi:hypothetical protein